MKFTATPPTVEGFYWCYLKDPNGGSKATLEVGQVHRVQNGFLRTVAGAFDYDWSGWLYWGDKLDHPVDINIKSNAS